MVCLSGFPSPRAWPHHACAVGQVLPGVPMTRRGHRGRRSPSIVQRAGGGQDLRSQDAPTPALRRRAGLSGQAEGWAPAALVEQPCPGSQPVVTLLPVSADPVLDAGVQHHRQQRHAAADHLDPGEHGRGEAHVRAAVRPAAGAEGAGESVRLRPTGASASPTPLMSQSPRGRLGWPPPLPSGAFTASVPCSPAGVPWNRLSDKPPALGPGLGVCPETKTIMLSAAAALRGVHWRWGSRGDAQGKVGPNQLASLCSKGKAGPPG